MTFKETLKSFLSERKDGDFYDSSITTYKRKLEVFFEYLTIKCGISDNNYQDILRGIGKEKILSSIDYYVQEYNIKFKVTVDNYFTVVRCYFDFISEKYNIKNDNFDSILRFNELKELVNLKIKELKLDSSDQKSPIMPPLFEKLNNFCNEKIDNLTVEQILNNQVVKEDDYNKPLVSFISAIVVKILMLTGIKNQVISRIIYKDLDLKLNKIKINNFWIHLPDKLGEQISKYNDIRSKITKSDSDEYSLFLNKKGEPLDNNSVMFDTLEPIIGNKKAECVAKHTIMNMILKGINSSIIQEFTSFGDDTILHCQELVNEEKAKEDQKSKNRYLDSKIRSMDNFDIL